MHSILVFAVFALAFSYTLAHDVTLDEEWNLWKQINNKRYSKTAEIIRYEIFFFISAYDLSFPALYTFVVVASGKIIGNSFKNTIFKLI